jgi:hypothetical protein
MVCPKGVHVQDVSILVLMPKTCQGFTNVVDVVVDYIPRASVGEYIERIKNNKDAPCQFIQWHYD